MEPLLARTSDRRVPNTVLTRKLLEMSDIRMMKELYATHQTTLPCHHFVGDSRRVHSVEVRPVVDPQRIAARKQLTIKTLTPPSSGALCHTNHFEGERLWRFTEEEVRESVKRLEDIREASSQAKLTSCDGVLELLTEHRGKYQRKTLASVAFFLQEKQAFCAAKYYFPTRTRHLKTVKLPCASRVR